MQLGITLTYLKLKKKQKKNPPQTKTANLSPYQKKTSENT